MEQYKREQEKQTRYSRVAGGILVLCLLAVFYIFLFNHGFKYWDPPRPDESLITLDFTEKYEHRIEISPDRLSENLWDSLGISYVPEENMLKITTISEVGRDKDIKYCIPVGSMWAIEYLKTSLISSVDWYSGEMWLNLFEKRV